MNGDSYRLFLIATAVFFGMCSCMQAQPADGISVKDFGAVGDGMADDTDAIQDAIDNAYFEDPPSPAPPFNPVFISGGPESGKYWGKTVYFPAGTYRTTHPIRMHVGLALAGDPCYVSIIESSATAALVCWEGEWDEQTLDWDKVWGFDKRCSGVTLSNLRIRGSDYGLHTLSVKAGGMQVSNCWFEGSLAGFCNTGFFMGSVVEKSKFNPALWLYAVDAEHGPRVNTSTFRDLEFGTDGLRSADWRLVLYGCIQANTFENLTFHNSARGIVLNAYISGMTNSFDHIRSDNTLGSSELMRVIAAYGLSITDVQAWDERSTIEIYSDDTDVVFLEDIIVAGINARGTTLTALNCAPIDSPGVGSVIQDEIAWPGDYSFEGDNSPSDTPMPWTQFRNSILPGSTDSDIFTIDTQSAGQTIDQYLYYELTDLDYLGGNDPVDIIVEWRMKLDVSSDLVYIDIGDGAKIYNFSVGASGLGGADSFIAMDTYTDYHTYRIEIPTVGGPANVYVDGIHQDTHSGYSGSFNGIRFGDNSLTRKSISYWDYLRWGAMAIECGYWGHYLGDISGSNGGGPDCRVDLCDLALVAEDWLKTTLPDGISKSFEGDNNPIYTGVPWTQHRYNPTGGVTDGDILTIDTMTDPTAIPAHHLWYDLADTATFDASNGDMTVEWRMKLDYYSDLVYIDIGDGSKIYNCAIASNGLLGPDASVSMDTYTNFHVYRLDILTPGGPADVYVDDIYRGIHSGYSGSINGIVFGDTSSTRMSLSYWDYIRWETSQQCGDVGYYPADIAGPDGSEPDCHVNIYDMTFLASDWLKCTNPDDPSACDNLNP